MITNERMLEVAKRHQDALIGDGSELLGYEFSVASIIAFARAIAAEQKDYVLARKHWEEAAFKRGYDMAALLNPTPSVPIEEVREMIELLRNRGKVYSELNEAADMLCKLARIKES